MNIFKIERTFRMFIHEGLHGKKEFLEAWKSVQDRLLDDIELGKTYVVQTKYKEAENPAEAIVDGTIIAKLDLVIGDNVIIAADLEKESANAFARGYAKAHQDAERNGVFRYWKAFDPEDQATWPDVGQQVLVTIWGDQIERVWLDTATDIRVDPDTNIPYVWRSDEWNAEDLDEVSAWMPLPEPYKQKGAEE